MKYTEDMSFEEACQAFLAEMKAGLATLHEHFDGETTDWEKLHLPLAKMISNETHGTLCDPEVVEVRPKELECDVVRYQNNKENGLPWWDCSTGIHTRYLQVCRMKTKASCSRNP